MATEETATGAIPFPYDPVRTSIVQVYREPGMIADRVLPFTPALGKREFKYFQYMIEDSFIIPDTQLGRKSLPNMVEFEGKEIIDQTQHFGLRDVVPQEDVAAAGAAGKSAREWADPIDTAVLQLTHLLKLDREKRVADLVFGTGSYDSSYRQALAGNDRFDVANSNPLESLETALTTPIFRPNLVIFGQEAWSKFRMHADVVKATNIQSGADSGYASRRAVAALLEVDEVLVGRSRVASNKEGQTLSLTRIWGKSVACIYRGAYGLGDDRPSGLDGSEKQEGEMNLMSDQKRPTFGFTASYKPLAVYSRFNEGMGAEGATEVMVRESCKEVVSGKNGFGYLLTTVIS